MTTLKGDAHLGEMLVRTGLITHAQLEEAQRDQRRRPGFVPLSTVLIDRRLIAKEQVDRLLANAKQRPRIGDLLVSMGLITRAQLQHALERQRALHVPLGQVLVGLGYLTEEAMRNALALQLNMRVIARMLNWSGTDKR